MVEKAANQERVNWSAKATVEKWDNPADREAGKAPDEVVESDGNLLLNEGITRMLNLITGTTTNPYNNANARLGVGNSSTAAAATQTALQGASQLFKAMEATYPQVAGSVMTFRSLFGDTEANFAWEEWSVDNGATPNENMNRKVAALGTKSGGDWQLTVTITLS